MARSLIGRAAPLVLAAALGFGAGHLQSAALAAEDSYAALDVFARVLAQIDAAYVDPISQRALVYHALDGLDDALDPHSRFLDPDAFRRAREEAEGQFVGVGAQLRAERCGLLVTSLIPDGPAERAGVAVGDCVVSIDGVGVGDLHLDDALARVRGKEGEAVTLELVRGNDVRRVPILRTRLVEAAVEGALFADGLAWLRIRQFRAGASAELAAEVTALGGESDLRGAVLDLRDNPGGRLDEAVATADLFLGDGRIVSTRGRAEASPVEVRDATPSRGDWTWPLVILVDGQSASAAEIVAGALQDHGRAVLVGEPTYGKGSVQTVYELEDGSALKLTIARYVLPSGRTIDDHRGLVPDVAAAPARLPSPAELLRSRIAGLALTDQARTDLLALVDRLPDERPPAPVPRSGPMSERLAKDPQLASAWKVLRERAGAR